MAQGGSLFGRADATLVGAALKESVANLPADLTAVYAKREQNLKEFSKGIQEAFNIYYADYNNTSEALKNSSQAVLNNLETGGVLNPYLLEQNNAIVNGFKQRLRSIPAGRKGDLERSKLRHEMNVYAQRNAANQVIFQNLAENTANGSILDDFGPQGSEKRKLLNLMMEDYNNGTSKTQRQYINGDFVYSLPGSNIKMTMKDLQNSLSVYDSNILADIQKDLNQEQQNGKKGLPHNPTQFYNKIRGKMKSNNDIDNIAKERFGDMPFSFEEYLRGAGAGTKEGNEVASYLMDALNGIGGIDVTGDGIVKQEDIDIYSDPKNAAVLSQAILGDPGVKKELTALYITKYAAEDAHGLGKSLIKNELTETKTSNFTVGGRVFNAADFQNAVFPFINNLDNMQIGDRAIKSPFTGVNYVKSEDGKYYRVSGTKDGEAIKDEDRGGYTLQELGAFEGWGQYVFQAGQQSTVNNDKLIAKYLKQ